MKVVAFVPIRMNSKRVPRKNLKLLGDRPLLSYIFETLLQVRNIDRIYAYCSSEEIFPFLPSGIEFLKRDAILDGDNVLGKEIYDSFCNLIKADYYILAHATSPFLKPSSIEDALENVMSGKFDSSFSAERRQTFAWFKSQPLNYDLDLVPRTQDIEPVFIETSAFFIFSSNLWQTRKRRIGYRPYIKIVDMIEAIDIDNQQDWAVAEIIMKALTKKDEF